MPEISDTDVAAVAKKLLCGISNNVAIKSIVPCRRGGNNKTYRVDTTDGPYLAKAYFRHPADERDRLSGEFLFSKYAEGAAAGMSPRAIARDEASNVAIYEFVDGRHFQVGEIGANEVDKAAAFFCALNAADARIGARGLPLASEAAFSINDHLTLISRRVDQLLAIDPADEENARALPFFGKLGEYWKSLCESTGRDAAAQGIDCGASLPENQRCVSPSDFGFHNALARPDGGICFIDFEYAGWDDPARMAGDFFAQLSIPVPGEYFTGFLDRCLQEFPGRDTLKRKALLLRPVYKIKWCCIALALFHPVNMARRKFADPELDEASAKRLQLAKAELILQSLGND